jgi:hypothetical protein
MRAKKSSKNFLDGPKISCRTYVVRGVEVMLDSDMAILFKTTTKRVNEAVKRHKDRFPKDFVFRLGDVELENLKSQIATSSLGTRGSRGSSTDPDLAISLDSGHDLDPNIDSSPDSSTDSEPEWGGRRRLPYVFAARGMVELASVLKWDI